MYNKTFCLHSSLPSSFHFLPPSLILIRANSEDYSLFYMLNAEVIYIMWSIVDYTTIVLKEMICLASNNLALFIMPEWRNMPRCFRLVKVDLQSRVLEMGWLSKRQCRSYAVRWSQMLLCTCYSILICLYSLE